MNFLSLQVRQLPASRISRGVAHVRAGCGAHKQAFLEINQLSVAHPFVFVCAVLHGRVNIMFDVQVTSKECVVEQDDKEEGAQIQSFTPQAM